MAFDETRYCKISALLPCLCIAAVSKKEKSFPLQRRRCSCFYLNWRCLISWSKFQDPEAQRIHSGTVILYQTRLSITVCFSNFTIKCPPFGLPIQDLIHGSNTRTNEFSLQVSRFWQPPFLKDWWYPSLSNCLSWQDYCGIRSKHNLLAFMGFTHLKLLTWSWTLWPLVYKDRTVWLKREKVSQMQCDISHFHFWKSFSLTLQFKRPWHTGGDNKKMLNTHLLILCV